MEQIKPSNSAIIIFVRNAEKGKVKTRLAATVGDEKALQIYVALLDHTRKIAQSLNVDRYLFYSQQINENDDWPADNFDKKIQNDGDLGEKMSHAFKTAFEKHDRVVIIGSDCASLSTAIVKEAYQQLEKYDFVIGPAFDGGYYLLGMKTFTPSLFQDINWSTELVFAQTKSRIDTLGKSLYLLPTLSDIDYEEDWNKYGWPLPDLNS